MSKFCKLLLPLLLFASASFGQVTQVINNGSPKILPRSPNLQAYSLFIVPVFPDTATALSASGIDSLGMVFQVRSNGNWYRRDTSAATHKWTLFGAGGGGGTWGSISGTLSSQTDLNTALGLKVNVGDTAAMLAVYLRTNVAAATYATITTVNGKLNLSDTSAQLNAYLRKILASGQIWVGNGSNIAAPVTISGDATISNTGVVTFANLLTAGSCTNCNLTYDAKGRITMAANGSGGSSALTNTHIFVGNGSNVATDVAMSGDAHISNTGAVTIQPNVVDNTKIAQAGAGTVSSNITGSTANHADNSLAAFAAALPATQVNAARGTSATTIGGIQSFVLGMVSGQQLDSAIYISLANAFDFTLDSVKNHFKIKALNSGTGTPTVLVHMPDSSIGQMPFPSGATFANPSQTIDGSVHNGSLTTAMRSDAAPAIGINAVTNPLAAQMPQNSVKANITGSTANATDITMPQLVTALGGTPVGSQVVTDPANGLFNTVPIALHTQVRAISTAALPANTYNNGTIGVGATITGNSNGALPAQDGVTLVANNRLAVNNEASPSHNGIYIVTQVGTGGTPFILTRGNYSSIAANMAAMSEIGVQEGTLYAGTKWYQQTTGAITFGTTALVYAREPLSTTGVTPGSYANASITVGPDGRLSFAANGGTGGNTITQTPNGDSIGINNVPSIWVRGVAESYNNPCYWCDRTMSNALAKFAYIRNTYSDAGDSGKLNICVGPGMDSFGDKFELWQKNFIDVLLPKYQFAGPGFFGGDMTNYNFTCTNGWTIRSLKTTPIARGIDGKECVSTSSDIIIQSGAQFSGYNQYQDVKIYTYDTTGAGTFVVKDGATTVATIDCSIGSGFTVTKIHLTAYQKHVLTLHETVAGAAHCYLLGVYLYSSNRTGIIVNKMATGSTDVTNWTGINATLYVQQLADIQPDLIVMGTGINNQAHNLDTLVARAGYDTLIGRARAAAPFVSIVIAKGTDYSQTRYGATTYQRSTYNRGVDYIVRKDSVASLDCDLIEGTFPKSLTLRTIALDSLHATSQAAYGFVTALLRNISGINVDIGFVAPSFFDYTSDADTISSNSNPKTFFGTAGLNMVYANMGYFDWKTSTGGELKIDPTPGAGQTTFTGPTSTFLFSGAGVQTTAAFTATGAGLTSAFKKASFGTAGAISGADVTINNTSGSTALYLGSGSTSGSYNLLVSQTDLGVMGTIGGTDASSNIGGAYKNSAFNITGRLNDMWITNMDATHDIAFGMGASGTEKMRLKLGGNLLVGTTLDSAAFLQPGAGTTTNAPLKFIAGSLLTTPKNGAIEFDGTNYYTTAGGTRTAITGSGVTSVGTFSGSSQSNGASISSNTITFGPADVSNPGMVTTGSQSFNGGKTFNNSATFVANAQVLHVVSTNTSGTVTAGTGAGTSPSVSFTGVDQTGAITVTTGTLPTGSGATIVTFTYSGTFPTNTFPIITPANATTAALSGVTMVFAAGTATNFTINAGTTALSAATTYKWNYYLGGQ